MLVHAAIDYYETATNFPYFPLSKSTFEDLSSTGNLTLIRNSGLRDMITQHYYHLEYMQTRLRLSTEWTLPLDAPFYLKTHAMKLDSSVVFLYPQRKLSGICKVHSRE